MALGNDAETPRAPRRYPHSGVSGDQSRSGDPTGGRVFFPGSSTPRESGPTGVLWPRPLPQSRSPLASRRGGSDRESRTGMYETTPTPDSPDNDEAARALQTALDRRDNGGPAGH